MSPPRKADAVPKADAAAARLALIASSDDYLLQQGLDDAVRQAVELLEGAEVERLPDAASPEDVAVELRSPSLFAANYELKHNA